MVVGFHLCSASWLDSYSAPYQITNAAIKFPELIEYTWFGWLGVELFFVISGFVITYSAERISASDFLWKRFLRLYPAAWVCSTITACFLFSLMSLPHVAVRWIWSVLLLPVRPWVSGAYWTLGIEMVFYALIWGLLVRKRFDWLEPVMLAVGVVSSCYWIVGGSLRAEWVFAHLWSRPLELSLIPYGCYFSLGTTIYLIKREGFSTVRAASIALCLTAAMIEIAFKTAHINQIFQIPVRAIIPQLFFLASMTAILASVLISGHASKLTQRIARTVGLATYPLYLLHEILGSFVLKEASALGRNAALAISIIVCVAISVIVSTYVEPAIREWLRAIAARQRHFEY